MSSNVIMYDSAKLYQAKAMIDFSTGPFKVALLGNSYTFDFGHTVYADLTNEVSAGNGYSAGGASLANFTATLNSGTHIVKFDADDLEFDASGGSIGPFRKAAIYLDATVNSIVKPLIGYDLLASVDLTIDDGNFFLIRWNGAGIITLSGAIS